MHLLVPAAVAALIGAAVSVSTVVVPGAGSSQRPATAINSPVAVGTREAGQIIQVPSRGGAAFTWPLSPRPAVHRRFEQPRDQWAPGHRGVDLLAAVGQPVLSAGQGVVAFSGVIAGRGVITIRHSGGLRTTYEPVGERLTPGTVVDRGARIGVISPAAGHCVPLTCLHWGAISGQAYRDPLSLLGFGRPILLPLG